MRTDQKLLYFSLNKKTVDSFYDYLDGSAWEFKDSFRRAINREDAKNFYHASDLMFFLDEQKAPESFYVIIDYLSFYNLQFDKQEKDKEKNADAIADPTEIKQHAFKPYINFEQFSVQEAAKIIRRTILKYPETMFLFDESWLDASEQEPKNTINFCNFLFYGNNTVVQDIFVGYHQYSVCNKEDPFLAIRRDRSNLFDGSNLRYAIMRFLYESLKVERYNFSIIQDSRKDNLAFVVEEEMAQNRFNSYCLYANGFRVLPISSSKDLKYFNEKCNNTNEKQKGNNIIPQLILRDFDLQFDDVDDRSSVKILVKTKNGDESKIIDVLDIYEVDKIRRVKRGVENDNYWYLLEQDDKKKSQIGIVLQWLDDANKFINDYWSNLRKIPTYFISKGVSNTQIQKEGLFLDEKDGCQIIPGLHKPIAGIYKSFRSLNTINKTSTRALNYGNKESEQNQNQSYYINTDRRNHEHGVPLDIYDLVKSMVSRAKRYQKDQKYTQSVILALDAIEVMNGFHEQLMLQAYHIAAVSENAIALNVLGGDDQALRKDAEFRINKIINDISRFIARPNSDDQERYNLKKNVLNQIFSDCRNYCKEKEHFEAEEAFISAMARLTEGFNLISLTNLVVSTFKTIKKHFNDYLEFCTKEDNYWFMNTIIDLTNQLKECNDNNGIKKNRIKRKYKRLTKQEWEEITVHAKQQVEQNDDEIIEWRSSNEEIASIDNKGLISPHRDGLIVIFSIYSDRTTCYPINVKLSTPKTNE